MSIITLKKYTKEGKLLQAQFHTLKGMNMLSYKKDNLEVIDQTTMDQFTERFAGLGAIIGPHFHRQRDDLIPSSFPKEVFPHIQTIEKKGIKDPFSHGIGRYVPWKIESSSEDGFSAVLQSNDSYQGVPLAQFEGTEFIMTYRAHLTPKGLLLKMHIEAERAALMGMHFYYALYGKAAYLQAQVDDQYNDAGTFKPIQSNWFPEEIHQLILPIEGDLDFGFCHHPNPCRGSATLFTEKYQLKISIQAPTSNNSFQVYHPKNASFFPKIGRAHV